MKNLLTTSPSQRTPLRKGLRQAGFVLFFLLAPLGGCQHRTGLQMGEPGSREIGVGEETDSSRAAREAMKLGMESYQKGDMQGAIRQWESALGLYKKAGKKSGISAGLTNLGVACMDTGDFIRASDAFEDALVLVRKQADATRLRDALRRSGWAFYNLGDYQTALERFQRALALDIELGEEEGRLIDLTYLANVRWQMGQYAKALKNYSELEKRAHKSGGAVREADASVGKGLIYDELGRYEKAMVLYRSAVELYRDQAAGSKGEAIALNNLGCVKSLTGRHDEALVDYTQALTIFREHEDLKGQAMAVSNIGQIHALFKKYPQSVEQFERALEIHRKIGDRRGQALDLMRLGRVYEKMEKESLAEHNLRAGLSMAEQIHRPDTLWRAYYRLGKFQEAKGDDEKALLNYQQAVATIEGMAGLLEGREDRQGFLGSKAEVYESLIHLLLKFHRRRPEAGYEKSAMICCEKRRGLKRRGRFDSLDKPFKDLKRQAYFDRQRLMRARLFKTEELLVREKNKPDAGKNPESIEKLDHLLDDLRGRYRTFIDTLRKEDPSLAVWMTSETIDLGETQMKLGPREVILEYYIASDQYAYIFVITADGLSVEFVPVDTDKLDKEVMQLRRLLQDPGIEHAPFDPRLNILAKRLYKTLLHPVEKYLEGKDTVGILRNRKLHYLPFQVLIRETEGEGGGRFLVEDYAIYYLNSRTLLGLTREGGSKTPSSPPSLVAFGNPDGTLPYAEEEVLELSSDFKGARVFLRKKATEADLKLFSSGFGLLHLATHGELDPYHPENSFLWFCPDKTEDGKLLVSEIYGLDLSRTDLVTLSACETALGKLAYGEEIVALSEAFLFAGTPTVVATLWRVDDRSTSLLMKQYYAHLKSGQDKLSALRLAQLEVMKTRGWDDEVELPVDYSHPYFWASFILLGEHL